MEAGWQVKRSEEVRSSVLQLLGRLLRNRVVDETDRGLGGRAGGVDEPGDAPAMTAAISSGGATLVLCDL